jgi:hypothetical protein
LCGGLHENHRDVHKRWVEFAGTVVEPSGLGQRHADDLQSQRYERQGI